MATGVVDEEGLPKSWQPVLECTLQGEEWGREYASFRVVGYRLCQSGKIDILRIKSLALVLHDLVLLTLAAFSLAPLRFIFS